MPHGPSGGDNSQPPLKRNQSVRPSSAIPMLSQATRQFLNPLVWSVISKLDSSGIRV
jgi:hypothetical protein